MKHLILIGILLSSALFLNAQTLTFPEISEETGIIKAKWSPFQLALVPEKCCHLVSGRADIYGLAVGLLVLEQQSAVLSVSLTSGQHKNYGLQCAAVTINDLNYGLNVSPIVGFIARNYGVQIGVVTVEADGGKRPEEFQSGTPGVQIGGVNIGNCIQIGAFNIGGGFQIGVINYNPKAWIPVLPLFNYASGR